MSIVSHLFVKFLDDSSEYDRARAYWVDLWEKIAPWRRHGWQQPWLSSGVVGGQELRDGDPIFSAFSPTRLCGIRVIQYPPESPSLEFDSWLETFGGELGRPGVIRELVIACALSEEGAEQARELMAQWCWDEEIESRRFVVPTFDYGHAGSRLAVLSPC